LQKKAEEISRRLVLNMHQCLEHTTSLGENNTLFGQNKHWDMSFPNHLARFLSVKRNPLPRKFNEGGGKKKVFKRSFYLDLKGFKQIEQT